MIANLLGLGPSLKNYNLTKMTGKNVNITFNAAIFDSDIMAVTNWVIVHDSRFNRDDYLKRLTELNITKVASFGLFEESLRRNPDLLNKMHKNELIHKFWGNLVKEELLLNVVIDFGIPFASYIGAKEINLYGCDFNYFLDEKGKAGYFDNFSGNFAFDHNKDSHANWASRSLVRLQEAKTLFALDDINIHWCNDAQN